MINRYSLSRHEVRRWRCQKDLFREQRHRHAALDERVGDASVVRGVVALRCPCGAALVELGPEAHEPWDVHTWKNHAYVRVSELTPGDVVEADHGLAIDRDRVIEVSPNVDGSTSIRVDGNREWFHYTAEAKIAKVTP